MNLNNSNLVTVLVIALGVVMLLRIVAPKLLKCEPYANEEYMAEEEMGEEYPMDQLKSVAQYEGFAAEGVPEEAIKALDSTDEISVGPEVSAEKNSVMDGRGFLASPLDPASSPVSSVSGDTVPSNYYFLDDGDDGRMSVQHNLCSRSCCSDQYPTPFKLKHDPYVCNAKNKDGSSKYIPSRVMCNNTFQDSGCLCLTKEQGEFLYNRGGNGRDWF